MRIASFFLAIPLSILLAGSATQTDWSGVPGVLGPVIEFGSDFCNDTDVMWYNTSGYITLNYRRTQIIDDFMECRFTEAGDIDGDGDYDLIAGRSYVSPTIVWYENIDGLGTSFSTHWISDGYAIIDIALADVDGDGVLDFLESDDVYPGSVDWHENYLGTGTHWLTHPIFNPFDDGRSLCSGDIDGDGDCDVVAGSFDIGSIKWFENLTGSGSDWSPHDVDSTFNGVCSVVVMDIDGDGDKDLVGAALWDDEIAWWENSDGLGHEWLKHTVRSAYDNASSVHCRDLDNDGDPDIIGTSQGFDQVTVWLNLDGIGTDWFECVIDETLDGASALSSGDYDGDGDIDLAASSEYYTYSKHEYRIRWYENVGGMGTEWITRIFQDEFGGVASVASGDLNQDGIEDIIGGSGQSGIVYWWNILEMQLTGSLESSVLYLQGDPEEIMIHWVSTEPQGTSICFQVRSCDYPDTTYMGDWSDTLFVPSSLSNVISPGDSYLQYKAILQTVDTDSTPILDEVSISWDLASCSDAVSPSNLSFSVVPNPTQAPVVRFMLTENTSSAISVSDITGRIVYRMEQSELPSGYHCINIEDLTPGIYFCRMSAGEFTATQRFVVIQ